MALVVKPGKLFINDAIGGSYDSAYLKVGRIVYDRDIKSVEFYLLTYVSEMARQNYKQPMLIDKVEAFGEEFDTHFSPDALNTTDNIVRAIYEYLLQLKREDGTLIYADWDSDVV